MKKSHTLLILLAITGLLYSTGTVAQHARIIVDPATTMVDGESDPYNKLRPGDSLFFMAGNRQYLFIRNFTGTKANPIVFINYQGVVSFNTDWYYGIKISNCRYTRLTGTGDPKSFYGFRIDRVKGGAGLSLGDLSTDFEGDHLYISNVPIAGVYAKTDPDCSFTSTRDKFTQYNTVFHDNYISNTGNEGFYIGSSFYGGETVNCKGRDTLIYPGILNGVRVYNNIIKGTGWDGIQVGSAFSDCRIYNNLVMFDSQAGVSSQMSGIMIGGGSQCDCYNNYIYKGKGDGIESLGIGGYKISNNVIIDAGRSFQPDNSSMMKHGIYVGDVSIKPGLAFTILNNRIINPKSDGIRFASTLSKNNLVASNTIINPGLGSSAYIVLTNPACDVRLKNNHLAPESKNPGLKDSIPVSDIIGSNRKYPEAEGDSLPYPNPVITNMSINYTLDTLSVVMLDIYSLDGNRIYHTEQKGLSAGSHTLTVDVHTFPVGVCLYTLRAGTRFFSGKFLKSHE